MSEPSVTAHPPRQGAFDLQESKLWTRRFTYVGGACTVVSAGITFRGMVHITGEPFWAAAFTLMSAVISFLFYAFLWRTFPRAKTEDRGPLLLWVFLPALLLVAATSTFLGILGLAGPKAELLAKRDLAEQAAAQIELHRQYRLAQTKSVESLQAQEREFGQLAQDEELSGRLSGSRGEGKISRDLVALSRAFQSAGTLLEDDLDLRLDAEQRALAAATAMRHIADEAQANTRSLGKIRETYQDELRHFNQAFAELQEGMGEQDLMTPIQGALKQQVLTPLSVHGKRKMARQKRATLAVTHLAEGSSREVEKSILAWGDVPTHESSLRIPDSIDAIEEHFGAVAHLAAYPVALDFLYPIVVLVALSFMRRGREAPRVPAPSRQTHDPPEDRTEHAPANPGSQSHVDQQVERLRRLRRDRRDGQAPVSH